MYIFLGRVGLILLPENDRREEGAKIEKNSRTNHLLVLLRDLKTERNLQTGYLHDRLKIEQHLHDYTLHICKKKAF